MTNYCHLSYEDRKNIEDGLNENKSINQIAKELNRNHSTILREIDRNKVYSKSNNWCTNKKYENPNYRRMPTEGQYMETDSSCHGEDQATLP